MVDQTEAWPVPAAEDVERLRGLEIRRIVADDDLDGVVGASLLLRRWPEAELLWCDPGSLRAGTMDGRIDRATALVDLPAVGRPGLVVDHHATNRPDAAAVQALRAAGGVDGWMAVPSATRAAAELMRAIGVPVADRDGLVSEVDRVDGGAVTLADMQDPPPALRLAKAVARSNAAEREAWSRLLATGIAWEAVLERRDVEARWQEVLTVDAAVIRLVDERTSWHDGLAVVRLDGTGLRSNGYLATARLGDACHAVCIVHGGPVTEPVAGVPPLEAWPVSASFYRNAFRDGPFGWDLTRLATALDPNGGGHHNACGCRVMALEDGQVVERDLEAPDVDANIAVWTDLWRGRSDWSA